MSWIVGIVVSVIHAFAAVTAAASAAGETPFLKEILMGRCYYAPPTGDAAQCPMAVGSIMGVLEGHLDADISADSFRPYFAAADFDVASTSTNETAVLQASSTTTAAGGSSSSIGGSLFTALQDTPGGAFLRGLVFCGIDQRQDCAPASSNAMKSFWTGAWQQFAAHLRGDIVVVLDDDDDGLDALVKGAIANLQPTSVSSVSIVAEDCKGGQAAQQVKDALDGVGVSSDLITCTENLWTIVICRANPAACTCVKQQQQQQQQQQATETDDLTPPSEGSKPDAEDATASASSSTSKAAVPPEPDQSGGSTTKGGESGGVYKALFWILLFTSGGFAYWVFSNKKKNEGYQRVGEQGTALVNPTPTV